MDFFVTFWGTRGSIPTPGPMTKRYGGNTSCVELRIDDVLFVCDGGTGLRELGLDLEKRRTAPEAIHMLFSHMHWDHIQGFPFFLPAYQPSTSLHVYETKPGEDRIQRLLKGQMRSEHFPVTFSELGARVVPRHFDAGGLAEVDGVTVRCFEQWHPGGSFAFSFEKAGKKVVYATDNELDQELTNREQSLERLGESRLAPPAFVDFVAEADLLIADGQYTDAEYPGRKGWGHARANTIADLATQARVKQCAIFHHDPMQSDEALDAKVGEARRRARAADSKVVVFGAREGLELKI